MRRLARRLACPAAILLLWLLAIRNGVGGDFFYDEAVYANLADHPFVSDYYADAVFFRHPPFVYLAYFTVAHAAPGVPREVAYRVTSLVFASVGLVLFWRLLRRVLAFDLVCGLSLFALAGSSLFVRYSLSATMYPFAFCFLSVALLGVATGRARLRTVGFLLLVYTHFWGYVVLALYLVGQRLEGRSVREILRDCGAVLLGMVPLAFISIIGLAFHLQRLRMVGLPEKYAILAFYVPLALWGGTIFAIAAGIKDGAWRHASLVVLTSFMAVLFFVAVSAVAPPFERYVYFFFPLLFLCGGIGIERLARWLGGAAPSPAMIAILTLLYLLPAPLLGEAEPKLFVNYFADNNRFADWRAVVDSCHRETVLTNNARSYAYYLAARRSGRVKLGALDRTGELRQFDDLPELVRKVSPGPPGCLVVDRHPFLVEVTAWIDRNLPACVPLDPSAKTLVYRCPGPAASSSR